VIVSAVVVASVVAFELSELLNTGLDRRSLAILVCETRKKRSVRHV